MGWIDDLKTRAEQSLQNIGKDAETYFKARVNDEFVKVGQAANGNLSAAEIAAGKTGSTAPIAASNQPAEVLNNAVQSGQQALKDYGKYIPFILVGAVAFVFLSKKARK